MRLTYPSQERTASLQTKQNNPLLRQYKRSEAIFILTLKNTSYRLRVASLFLNGRFHRIDSQFVVTEINLQKIPLFIRMEADIFRDQRFERALEIFLCLSRSALLPRQGIRFP